MEHGFPERNRKSALRFAEVQVLMPDKPYTVQRGSPCFTGLAAGLAEKRGT